MTLKELSYKISMSIGLKIATQDYYNGRETENTLFVMITK